MAAGLKRVVVAAVAIVALAWALAPAVRAAQLVARRAAIPDLAELLAPLGPSEDVTFTASDGVRLAGTYLDATSAKGVVILVHGFKTYRQEMVEYAAFLRDAGYAVLLYDGRGCGTSAGVFGVGATEDRDVVGAVSYVRSRGGAGSDHVAVLGISLGAGDALLAAAKDDRIQGVIADSSWPDEVFQLERMSSLPLGPLSVPLPPYEPALLAAVIGGRLEDARPVDAVSQIAPRAVLLIHSADDTNATTPLSGAKAIFAAAARPKDFWIVPSGGHAGALHAHPDEYKARVLAFLAAALK
ncbi:MAG TPA: alpha/beta fold hydrolase [Candidatus Limnocylindria bacterium]|nr:alpha/beta fold hydrolase [Candidatus Limnocylindria bacterium]